MRFCPQCHLIMEPAECGGLPISACRSCGGLWFPSGELSTVLLLGPEVFAPVAELFPGAPRSEAYAGLSLNCPDCRIVTLEPRALPNVDAQSADCPKCGGSLLDSNARTAILGVTQQTIVERQPEPVRHAKPVQQTDAPSSSVQPSPPGDYVRANEEYARRFVHGALVKEPRRQLVIVTCMDARMQVYEIMGLRPGDANILRNAGGIVTEDVLRSLIVSNHLLGTREIVIINHTDCGLLAITDEGFSDRLTSQTGVASVTPATFHAFTDLESNVRRQMKKVRTHPWIPKEVSVRGFVYDVQTGRLTEVMPAAPDAPQIDPNERQT